jgi:hypothetical protein
MRAWINNSEQRRLWLATPAALVIDEPGFSLETTAVTRQRSRCANHPVTGDDDGDWVGAVGGADGA